MHLGQMCFGPAQVGVRRLRALAGNLPTSAAYFRARDGAKTEWGTAEDLLAALLNVALWDRHDWLVTHSAKGTQVPEPEPVRSPWDAEPLPPQMNTPDELAAFLGSPMRYIGGSAS